MVVRSCLASGERILVAALCAILMSGCAGISEPTKQILKDSINCAQASSDRETLEADKAGALWRFAQGLQGIAPPMVVISLIRGAFNSPPGLYLDHWRVASGTYNERIDDRVEAIDRECGS